LPIIVDSNPQQGDTIQMLISYYPPGFNQQFAVADREVFLVQPNKKREQAYEQQRQLVKKSLLEIAQITDPQTIRDIHGKIINDTRYYSNNNPMETRSNRVALTAAERKELARSVAEKIPEKSEQPLDLWGSELTILNLETTQELFGVDTLYSMSQKQFLDFCMDIANGRQRPQIRDERKVGTFFASVKELLPSLEYEDVLQRIVIMHYLMRPQQSPVGDFVLPFEDMDRFEASPYMIEASLVNNASQELASIVSERTTKTFCEVAEKILGKNKPSVDQMYWIKDLMESNIDEGAEREPYEDLLRQLEEKLELAYY
jgi:hypothetical protein